MRRATPVLLALLLVVSTLAAVPAATMAQETEAVTEPANENATAPGAQLAGVVSVQEAELDGEVQSRSFDIRIAQANTDDAKASVVAEQVNDSEARLDELQQRKQMLEQACENGSMSEGEYRAKAAQFHAETKNIQRLATKTNETASQLPTEVLEKKGISATAITTLSQRASELSGPEVAAIAQGIAGPNVGQQARPDVASDRGGDVANRTEVDDRPGTGPERPQSAERTHDTAATPTNETATNAGETGPLTGGGYNTTDAGQ